MNTPVDLRLAPGALGTWAVCALAVRTAYAPVVLAALATLGVIAWVWPRRRAEHRSAWRGWLSLTLALGCAIAVSAGAVAAAQVGHRQGQVEAVLAAAGPTARFHLRLISEVKEGAAGPGAHAMITGLTTPGARLPLRFPAYLIGAKDHWRVGQHLSVSAELSSGPEHRMFLRLREAHHEAPPVGVFAMVDALRTGVRAASADLPPHARGLIPGVSIGDDRRLPHHLREAMRTTSLTHITAVSGAHVAVVIGSLLFVLARAPVWVRLGLAAPTLITMVLVVLPTPSVLRAAGMGLLTLLAATRRRPRLALPVLLFTVTVLLAHDPWLATSIGFGLSVAATAGILLSARPIAGALGGGRTARAVAVPLAAQLWCAPLLLTFDAHLATYSVPANLLAVPALAPATILGLASALVAQFSPAGAAALAGLGRYFTAWIVTVATFFARLPAAKIPWLGGPVGVATLILACLTTILVLVRIRRRNTWQA